MSANLCPECTAGKCQNCSGDAWDLDTDQPTACPCWENQHDGRVVEPGTRDDMDDETYHADPLMWAGGSLSSTMAKLIVQPGGPAKLKQLLAVPPEPKPAFDIGHAVHKLVLGTGPELRLIPFEEWRTNEAKALVKEAREAGAVPLKPAQWAQVQAMAGALTRHDHAMELLSEGRPEVSAFHKTEDGLWLRGRFDWLRPDGMVDFKTAAAADPGSFRRDAAKYGYHIQEGHYRFIAERLGVVAEDDPFWFIVQEKTAPYLVSVIELSPAFLDIGRAEAARAYDLWRECVTTDIWPGYADRVVTVDPPAWLRDRAAETLDPEIEAAFAALLGEYA